MKPQDLPQAGASLLTLDQLAERFRTFCQRRPIARLEVFGSAATGWARHDSDLDLLVTLRDGASVSTAELLDMAGEAEELAGVPVDFVLRENVDRSRRDEQREHIVGTARCIYGG